MTKRSVLLTAVPLALLAVCAAVLLLACGTVLSQEYLSARPNSTVKAAVPFSPQNLRFCGDPQSRHFCGNAVRHRIAGRRAI